ncbi:MAG: TetR/AcrR family transcriptional regulator [Chthoniobacterales bacterium]
MILEAAASVFLEHGAGASTARIAERAGISEGILFKRFKTKEALFEAAMIADAGSDQWRKVLLDSVGKGSPHENLKNAILGLCEKLEKLIPKLMVRDGQGARRPPPSATKSPPLEDAAAIARYLKRETKCGRLQIAQCDLHAHEIVGAVAHYAMMMFRHETKICSKERLAKHLADVHLRESRDLFAEEKRTKKL